MNKWLALLGHIVLLKCDGWLDEEEYHDLVELIRDHIISIREPIDSITTKTL